MSLLSPSSLPPSRWRVEPVQKRSFLQKVVLREQKEDGSAIETPIPDQPTTRSEKKAKAKYHAAERKRIAEELKNEKKETPKRFKRGGNQGIRETGTIDVIFSSQVFTMEATLLDTMQAVKEQACKEFDLIPDDNILKACCVNASHTRIGDMSPWDADFVLEKKVASADKSDNNGDSDDGGISKSCEGRRSD